MPSYKLLLLLPILLASSCRDPEQRYVIRGVVVEKENIIEAYILTTIWVEDEANPIAGAIVTVSFDQFAQDLVVPSVSTNAQGEYSLIIPKLMPSKDSHDYYWLTIERAGGTKLVQKITIGPMMSYGQNTVVFLKPKIAARPRPVDGMSNN